MTSGLTNRRHQPPLALAATVLRVPLSQFTPRGGDGSAFYVRHHYTLCNHSAFYFIV